MIRRAFVVVMILAVAGVAGADGGLRAVGRIRPVDPGPSLMVAAGTGYGFTGAVLEQEDAHHRVLGNLALAGRPLPWLELGGLLAGRYDKHTGWTPDDGWIGDPRLWVQAGGRLATGTWLAARAGAWLPGRNAPSVELDAATLDATLALTWAPGATALTATAGYRVDRSAASAEPEVLSDPDRLALGLSQYDAVLLGVGVVHRARRWELLGEVTSELLIGDYAPGPLGSPLRVGAGARNAVTDTVRLEALVEVSPGERPGAMGGDPLVAIEPRVTAVIGLSWRPNPPKPARLGGGEVDVDVVRPDDRVVTPPPAPTTGGIAGRVVGADGAPVAGATVKLGAGAVTTDGDGRFELDGLPAGSISVTIEAAGHERAIRTVAVTAGSDATLDVTLTPLPPPAQIRGVVRSFDGKGLPANIKIVPGDLDVTANPDGSWSVDVAPGSYEVTVVMGGYVTQTLKVTVEEQSVVVRTIELRRKR